MVSELLNATELLEAILFQNENLGVQLAFCFCEYMYR